ncbi:YihY/virulence factor BrkB family protein [Mollicutes bacterium LVI A0039]|nr:YihY/virulence factor BrkB family protein [Mollicutes bacterium LVI A0039]
MKHLQLTKRYFLNVLQILKDKRHEQKSKALAFALMYTILPILLLVNLAVKFLPSKFLELIEELLFLIPLQFRNPVIDFLHNYEYQTVSPLLFLFLIVLIFYTIAVNVRLVIEISNDCYDYSQERSKPKELLISFVLFIFIGFGVLSLFAIVIAGQALRGFLIMNDATNIARIVSQILQMKNLITIIILFMVFYTTYYFAPNVKSTFKTTIVGTLMSTIGLFFASYGFEIYLSKSSTYEILYGAVYSQYLLFLFGMYIACQIIVASMIVNSLIFENIKIRLYHVQHSKTLIDVEFDTQILEFDNETEHNNSKTPT